MFVNKVKINTPRFPMLLPKESPGKPHYNTAIPPFLDRPRPSPLHPLILRYPHFLGEVFRPPPPFISINFEKLENPPPPPLYEEGEGGGGEWFELWKGWRRKAVVSDLQFAKRCCESFLQEFSFSLKNPNFLRKKGKWNKFSFKNLNWILILPSQHSKYVSN